LAKDPPSASLFPVEPANDPESAATPEGCTAAPILLVEDNDTDVYVIRNIVSQCGLRSELQRLQDGAEALEYLSKLEQDESRPVPCLVLLDLSLPKVGGIEVLQKLRNSKRCSSITVIIVSSSDSQLDMDSATSLGVGAYFRKPSDLSAYMELADVIKRLLTAPGGPGIQ
jgi:two-component system response regulator